MPWAVSRSAASSASSARVQAPKLHRFASHWARVLQSAKSRDWCVSPSKRNSATVPLGAGVLLLGREQSLQTKLPVKTTRGKRAFGPM